MSTSQGALEETFQCESCDKWIRDIVMLIDHDCEHIIPADALSKQEKSTLLYIEARIVDGRAVLNSSQMNYEDQQSIKLFAAAELLDVQEKEPPVGEPQQEVVKFTDAAWDLAAECRKLRGQKNLD